MPASSPITSQTVGKSFTIAISILGVGAVAQIGAISWAFTLKFNAPQALANSPTDEELAPIIGRLTMPSDGGRDPELGADPFAEAPLALNTAPPKPTPVPLSVQRSFETGGGARFDELVTQGKMLRERGDTSTALVRFREAATLSPRSPVPPAELAATFEKMGLAAKAAEQWRRIYEMGGLAGIYFNLAEAKLKESQARAIRQAVTKDSPVEPDGASDGKTLTLMPVRIVEQADDDSVRKFSLQIPIRARANAKIDAHELVIHVLFYDIVDGQNVVQTSANVNSRWMAAPADWTESDIEELAVEYQLPKADSKGTKRDDRKFFGYIVRIYYREQLQAAVAEPERLAQEYPAPPTLSKETDK